MIHDLAVVGAGPAGLAVAIGARLRGLSVVVAERGRAPLDKACGEGVMPAGLQALRELGVLEVLDGARTAPIRGIRYINEDGRAAAAPLPGEGGLGIRRVALSAALFARARAVGVDIREGTSARWLGRHALGSAPAVGAAHLLAFGDERITTRFLVAADGLRSKLRAQAGLAVPARRGSSRRFGIRRHFAVTPWTDHVEIHFAGGVEAYVTPVGPAEVGIAFLWDADRREGSASFDAHLARFPRLLGRLAGAAATSSARGAGPLAQAAHAVVADDFALAGDAAGYIDAITGEGISLALRTAGVLVRELGERRAGVMRAYAAHHARALRQYALLTNALLWVAARPRLRRPLVRLMGRWPGLFRFLLHRALGPPAPGPGVRAGEPG